MLLKQKKERKAVNRTQTLTLILCCLTLSCKQLNETLKLSTPYIRGLNIRQLLPPVKEALIKDDDASDA